MTEALPCAHLPMGELAPKGRTWPLVEWPIDFVGERAPDNVFELRPVKVVDSAEREILFSVVVASLGRFVTVDSLETLTGPSP